MMGRYQSYFVFLLLKIRVFIVSINRLYIVYRERIYIFFTDFNSQAVACIICCITKKNQTSITSLHGYILRCTVSFIYTTRNILLRDLIFLIFKPLPCK